MTDTENAFSSTDELGTFLESQNDTVRTWALDLFESYKEVVDEVAPEDLTEC